MSQVDQRATQIQKDLHERLSEVLNRHVAPIFKDGTKFTVIARTPGHNEADVLVTNDSLDEIAKLVGRSKQREVIE